MPGNDLLFSGTSNPITPNVAPGCGYTLRAISRASFAAAASKSGSATRGIDPVVHEKSGISPQALKATFLHSRTETQDITTTDNISPRDVAVSVIPARVKIRLVGALVTRARIVGHGPVMSADRLAMAS